MLSFEDDFIIYDSHEDCLRNNADKVFVLVKPTLTQHQIQCKGYGDVSGWEEVEDTMTTFQTQWENCELKSSVPNACRTPAEYDTTPPFLMDYTGTAPSDRTNYYIPVGCSANENRDCENVQDVDRIFLKLTNKQKAVCEHDFVGGNRRSCGQHRKYVWYSSPEYTTHARVKPQQHTQEYKHNFFNG